MRIRPHVEASPLVSSSAAVYMDDPDAVVSGRRIELARELLLVLNWSILIGCVAGLIVGAIQHADCPPGIHHTKYSPLKFLHTHVDYPVVRLTVPEHLPPVTLTLIYLNHTSADGVCGVICGTRIVHVRARALRLGCNLHDREPDEIDR